MPRSAIPSTSSRREQPDPILQAPRPRSEQLLAAVFVVMPTLALAAAVPLTWGWGLNWTDVGLAVGFYFLSGFGVTIGFHRYFTHRAFKTGRALRVGLAIAGSLALEGDVITWVADHRRHHAFSDRPGDPHSPWLYGTGFRALCKGFAHAHMGWLFGRDRTNIARFAPDLLADRDIARISRQFPLWTAASLLAPALLGGLLTMSLWGARHGVLLGRAGPCGRAAPRHLVDQLGLPHVRHAALQTRDNSTNFWPLAIPSMGESWHNLHHADPTCARHGVQRGQLDMSARAIRIFEQLGWASDVRWPTSARLARLARATTEAKG